MSGFIVDHAAAVGVFEEDLPWSERLDVDENAVSGGKGQLKPEAARAQLAFIAEVYWTDLI